MDRYSEIDSIMASRSLATDPAFDALHILIEPIPCIDGCPLGLYYPDTATMILPPDFTEGALFHELGHRHGHYYYSNLSELYAEDFRKKYQSGRVLLYAGNHIERLPKFGVLFEEGERGAVEIALDNPPTMDNLRNFKTQVLSHQVYAEKAPRFFYVNNEVPVARVEFTKGVDWLVIIGATLSAITVAGVGAIGYAVYKVSKDLPWIIPLALASVGSFFLLRAGARMGYVTIG